MNERRRSQPGLEDFWEDADLEAAPEHPLERELTYRLDVLARYEAMIDRLAGCDGEAEALADVAVQQAKQRQAIAALRAALARCPSAPPRLRVK